MAAAMGSIELLRHHLDRISPAKREELFVRIDTSMHRMTMMLDEILTLSRIDAGRVQTMLGPLDLPAFVRNTVEEIRIGDRDGHEFTVSTSGEAAPFPSDPNLLHHILSNLLSNAVRYSPPASLVAVRLAADDREIVLTVDDQGIGIPEADRERIFHPFERGSNVGNIKGTGLGLNIVKRMTEMLGGTIHAEPGAERGSRFTLRLPRHPNTPT
jgi:signal transduction histidine kinase